MKKQDRHPTKNKSVFPTPSPTSISLPMKDRNLLLHLLEIGNKRFNVKEYSRINKLPRGTVYDILNRLEKKEFVKREEYDNKISGKGKIYLEATKGSVGRSRMGCRKNQLSTHWNKFNLVISNKEKFSITRLKTLTSKVKENKACKNLYQIIAEFDDAKIIINPKQVILSIFEIISDSVEESDISSLSRALKYAEMLKEIGLETEGLMVERGHWARTESILSDFLFEKVDKRYFLTLSDGSKFWIDHSPDKDGKPKREDETDNKVVRENIDNALDKIGSGNINLSDINEINKSLGWITKVESLRLQDKIEENKLKRLELEKPITKLESTYMGYFG